MIPLGAALIGALYVFCLVRDLPRKLAWQVGCYSTAFVAANAIIGVFRVDARDIEIGIMCMLGSFVVVTRGHVIRAFESELFDLPPDVAQRYNQFPGRYQLAGIVLGLAVALPIVVLRGDL